MFPGVYGFAWDAGHIVFLGAFFGVVAVIAATVAVAVRRSLTDLGTHRDGAIRWESEFRDLPARLRACRHELTGEVASRTCGNRFDCRSCAEHARLAVQRAGEGVLSAPGPVSGFDVRPDRLYHRGHTWVRLGRDGVAEVGLDDLAARVVGAPESVTLAEPGSRVRVGGTAWQTSKDGVSARVLSPVDGTVVERGGPGDPFYLRVRLDGDPPDLRHLLSPREAGAWMMREAEQLQAALSPVALGATLADGGLPVGDLSPLMTPERLDVVWGDVFLDP